MTFKYIYKSDLPYDWQTFFQDPATPTMESLVDSYQSTFFYLIFVFTLVIVFLLKISYSFNINKNKIPFVLPNPILTEIVWTTLPLVTLFFIAIPSFILLYAQDEIIDPRMTLHVIGYQWYWSYQYTI